MGINVQRCDQFDIEGFRRHRKCRSNPKDQGLHCFIHPNNGSKSYNIIAVTSFMYSVIKLASSDLLQGWGYSVSTLDVFLLTLFDKYAELLKRRFSEDFQEVSAPSISIPLTKF